MNDRDTPSASDSGLHISPLPRIGQEMGRFIIEKELPRGGQARVYRAWQTDLQRAVALKLLPSSFSTDQDAAARFKLEIENVARISHPNIVRVYEAGEIEGHPYFTMEFLEGRDAESMIQHGPVDPDEAASIMEAVARAVQEAHRAGIIHRDIKPGNIILRKDDTPVLTDFGLAQDLTHSNQLTRTGISMGTPAYMSPEQARGERNRVGVKSDVYALGATLYSLLTGKRPVEGDSAYELMVKVAELQVPKWPRLAIEDVPADLRAIVEMAMSNDPAKRYDSANDFADDLERFLHGEWVVARSRSTLAKMWVRSRRYLPVAAVMVIALGLAGGMVYTGLNPQEITNTEGPILDEDRLIGDDPEASSEEVEDLFRSTFAISGAGFNRASGGEIVLTSTGPEPILITPREPTCWGDFTLTTEFRVNGVDGPLEFRVGMPYGVEGAETAYTISLGDISRDRFELRRLGVPVLSGYHFGSRNPLLVEGIWYRATISRSAETLGFTMTRTDTGQVVAAFQYMDEYPALISGRNENGTFGRQHFGIGASSRVLSLRDVTVSHRDTAHTTEALLFSVGQFAEAELRLTARMADPLPTSATAQEKNERAELYYLRARCHVMQGSNEAALNDVNSAKILDPQPDLRARLFLMGSRFATEEGDDESALAQLSVAQFSADSIPGFTTRLYYDAHTRARMLEADAPQRALLYYDYVARSALGSAWLVCDSLYHAAELRLAATPLEPELETELRRAALASLERLASANYERFGATYSAAMVRLFELRWSELMGGEDAYDALSVAADRITDAVGDYGVDDAKLREPLIRACWAGRLTGFPGDFEPYADATGWVTRLEDAGAEPERVAFLRALMAEERPELNGDTEARIENWRELANLLELDEPSHGLMAAVADYFIGATIDGDDLKRRNDVLRRAIRRDYDQIAAVWLGDAGPDRFADYCIALYTAGLNRAEAIVTLETAAKAPAAGALKLLADRAEAWLPAPR